MDTLRSIRLLVGGTCRTEDTTGDSCGGNQNILPMPQETVNVDYESQGFPAAASWLLRSLLASCLPNGWK